MLPDRFKEFVMGLDMYLTAEKYVTGYKHANDAERAMYTGILKALGLEGFRCEDSPSLTVKINALYWRKANAIHNWFVQNVQKGTDDCGTYYVEREKLEELAKVCETVIEKSVLADGQIHVSTGFSAAGPVKEFRPGKVVTNPEVANSLLPPTGGFFFGSTELTEYYIQDLKDTAEGLRKLLADQRFEDCTFHYHSAW